MPLDTASLKAAIKSAYTSVKEYDGSPGRTTDDAVEVIATALATALTVFVKSGTVTTTVAPGILVQVTPATGTGATTGPGTGTGSVS